MVESIKPEIKEYLKQYGGHTLAYSTVQPGMEHFIAEGVGYIPYMKHWFGQPLVLSDPIVSDDNLEHITDKFLEQYSKPGFIQISTKYGKVLDQRGFDITDFGTDTHIELNKFTLKGKDFEYVRRKKNIALRGGLEVREVTEFSDLDISIMKEISDEWLKTKSLKIEMPFLTRPLDYKIHESVRYFLGYKDDDLVGYMFFDPMFRENKVIGYYADINRVSSRAPDGTMQALVCEAADIFKNEEVELISLGLSPFYKVSADNPTFESRNRIVQSESEKTYNDPFMDALYGFKGQSFNKSRFRGVDHMTHIATKGTVFGLAQFVGLYYLQGIPFIRIQARKMLSKLKLGRETNEG